MATKSNSTTHIHESSQKEKTIVNAPKGILCGV
jgi:hypothetical protein